MVQPFDFPNKQSVISHRNSRRNRGTCANTGTGTGTFAVSVRLNGGSSLLTSTPKSDSRRSRLSSKRLFQGRSVREYAGQNAYDFKNSSTSDLESEFDDFLVELDEVDSEQFSEKKKSIKEIALKGQEIFWFILREELSSRERAEPGCLRDLSIPPSKQRDAILRQTLAGGGLTLREMANNFSKTAYRQAVRELADSVDLDSLTYSTFSDLLTGIFQEGEVTRERVLVLYYFCSDLALKAAYLHLSNQFRQLVQWISHFISNNLSVWVNKRGGWAAVLDESTDYILKVAVAGFCVVGIITCVLFMTKHYTK